MKPAAHSQSLLIISRIALNISQHELLPPSSHQCLMSVYYSSPSSVSPSILFQSMELTWLPAVPSTFTRALASSFNPVCTCSFVRNDSTSSMGHWMRLTPVLLSTATVRGIDCKSGRQTQWDNQWFIRILSENCIESYTRASPVVLSMWACKNISHMQV